MIVGNQRTLGSKAARGLSVIEKVMSIFYLVGPLQDATDMISGLLEPRLPLPPA